MKRFVLAVLTLVVLTVLAACGSVEPDAPATDPTSDTLTFNIDPSTQQAKLLEAPTTTDLNVQGKSGRRVLSGKDLAVKSFKFTFQKGNTLKLDAAFKNVSACNLSEFTFTQGKGTRNIVSSVEPVVTAKDLGGDGILSPKEVTKPLTFKVKHKGKPFIYQVKVEALVSCKVPPPPVEKCSDPVIIPDDVLRQYVREALNKPKGDITCADMASLTELEVFNSLDEFLAPVKNLNGIQFATGLKKLNFFIPNEDVPPTYFEPLSALTNLTDLGLGNNRIEFENEDYSIDLEDVDFSLLARLTNLTSLVLPDTQVGDISFLKGLTNLVHLDLSNNIIADYSPISNLTALKILDLSRDFLVSDLPGVSDISFLTDVTSLTVLELEFNAASDLTPLSGLTNLEGLDLTGNAVSDLAPVSDLTNLTTLYLGGNNVTDLSPLAGLTTLKTLGLGSNSLSDLTPLSGLTNLTYLGLDSNDITDLSPLATLTKLDDLDLQGNFITDLSSLVANPRFGEGDDLAILNFNCLDTTADQTLSDIETIEDRNPNAQNVDARFQREGEEAVGCDSAPPPPPARECSNPVVIPDLGLRISITSALGQNPEEEGVREEFTCAEMATLRYLSNYDMVPFENLEGIQYAINLEGLDTLVTLSGFGESGLKPLESLTKLTHIYFYGEDPSDSSKIDFSPLSNLTSLVSLTLHTAQIEDLSFLSTLTNLESLDLLVDGIDDLNALGSLVSLKDLYLSRRLPAANLPSVTDFGFLSRLTRLESLGLRDTLISDLSPVASLTNLRILDLFGAKVSNLTPLAKLNKLERLDLQYNLITDIGPLAANPGIGDGDDYIDIRSNCLDPAPESDDTQNYEVIEQRNPDVENVVWFNISESCSEGE